MSYSRLCSVHPPSLDVSLLGTLEEYVEAKWLCAKLVHIYWQELINQDAITYDSSVVMSWLWTRFSSTNTRFNQLLGLSCHFIRTFFVYQLSFMSLNLISKSSERMLMPINANEWNGNFTFTFIFAPGTPNKNLSWGLSTTYADESVCVGDVQWHIVYSSIVYHLSNKSHAVDEANCVVYQVRAT